MEGLEVLAEMNKTIVDESFVPYVDLRIKHTIILDDPFDDLPKMEIPNQSPIPTAKMLKSVRIGADEEIKLESKMTEEEREMKLKERDAEAQALTLELLGALPEASLKPPENVLFVCKLNPITKDKDLKLIFSRFGKIVGCEIVKDKKTMQSLQYGFIEFQEKEACEEAYFKMNNALIDGRRIKVDFSQSVAKYKIEEKKEKYELKEKFTQKRELLVIEGSDRSKSSLRRDKKKPERERDHSADRRKRDRRE